MTFLRPLFLFSLFATGSLMAVDASPAVPVVRAHTGDIRRFVTLPGTLRANRQVTLYAKVAGYLKSIGVDKGDKVAAGQVLAQLELPELQADLLSNEAELKVAKAEVGRMRIARDKAPDLITPQAVDALEGRLAVAQAKVDQTNSMLRYSEMTAPFAGIVTMRYVDAGAFVPAASGSSNPGAAAVLTLMDMDTVRATVAVPEIEAANVEVGQPVIVTADSLPGRTFKGKVSRQSYALDEGTRSVSVEADLPNPDGVLRPGMYVSIRIGLELHAGAKLLPVSAIIREKTATYVFILKDGRAERTTVHTGFNDGTDVEILDGLTEDARVLVPVKLTLVPGQAVTAQEAP